MTISLDDVIAELSAENRAKVEEGAKRIYDECLTLPEQGETAVLARLAPSSTFALGLDASAIDQQVQRPA